MIAKTDPNMFRYRTSALVSAIALVFAAPALARQPTAENVRACVPACPTGPVIVYFEWDSAEITSDAAATLDEVVRHYTSSFCSSRIRLEGHTDRAGAADYNQRLSDRMTGSVRSYLETNGIPADMISDTAYGEEQLRVPTEDGVRQPENRRVEIYYDPR